MEFTINIKMDGQDFENLSRTFVDFFAPIAGNVKEEIEKETNSCEFKAHIDEKTGTLVVEANSGYCPVGEVKERLKGKK